MGKLDEAQAKLFERASLAALATIRKDGTPHVSPVWAEYDGEHVLLNTARGRLKERHILRDPRVTVTIWDPASPFYYVEVTGTAELVEDGADAQIDRLAKKYLGVDSYPFRRVEEQRVVIRVTPELIAGVAA
jgi:PPOX class probable F420-dependent enzyme